MRKPPAQNDLLQLRLNAIADAQKNARVALFVAALASGAILAAEWNSYFSWDRQWADLLAQPARWGQRELLAQQIKSWIDTNGVNLALVGLRVSVSDAAVLGSIILLVLSFYLRMTARRENDEVGTTLREVANAPFDVRFLVFEQIRSAAVFNPGSVDDTPIDDLVDRRPPSSIPLAGTAHGRLTYLPAWTVFAIVLTDVYFAFWYVSPWSGNDLPAFQHLPWQFQIQLFAGIGFALLFGGMVWRFCRLARCYQRATQKIVNQFRTTRLASRGQKRRSVLGHSGRAAPMLESVRSVRRTARASFSAPAP